MKDIEKFGFKSLRLVELVWPLGAAIFNADKINSDDDIEIIEFIIQPKSIGFECNVINSPEQIPNKLCINLIDTIEKYIVKMNKMFNEGSMYKDALKHYIERSITLYNNNNNLNTSNLYNVVRLTQYKCDHTNHYS